MKPDNHKIALGIIKGDRDSFNFFFNHYYSYMGHVAFSILNSFEDAEEIIQESFLKLWENRVNINPEQDLKYYMAQIIRNKCFNHLSHQKVKMRHAEHMQVYGERESHDLDQLLIAKELEQRLEKIIESLPPKCQTIFKMSRYEGLKYKEIAQQLDIAEKTVEQQVSKALKCLREELAPYISNGSIAVLLYLQLIKEIVTNIM